jgi:hypothetical protein
MSPDHACLIPSRHRGAALAALPAVTLVALALLAAGCGPRVGGAPSPGSPEGAAPNPGARIRSSASLAIDEPSPGARVPAGKVRVRLTLTGGRVIPDTTTRLAPDEGHIHLLLDGRVVSMTYGVEQEIVATRGPHVLQAEFAANDHFPFEPRVITTVTFVAE